MFEFGIKVVYFHGDNCENGTNRYFALNISYIFAHYLSFNKDDDSFGAVALLQWCSYHVIYVCMYMYVYLFQPLWP